ncbi:bacterial nucleoid protein Hbs [Sphingomonas laterariae]|uniref:Bacterial nucleoid protein Hbs n=1 Tax=Edaphosphingomonas laterariae TaxID=861865 RepID=A0A239KR64_9SPHN|nr:HU family DNA-binding protein [Sphingomonas laterariae]SNT20029.1 bacterial nucleoid protein Hbs [Sphingomonas laterariae]
MTGNEIIERIATAQGKSKAETKLIVDAVFTEIAEAAASGHEVSINGFGKFATKRTAERQGLNPATKEPITIQAATKIGFKPAKALKDKVNG